MTGSPNLAQLERAAFCDALLDAGPHAPTLCEGWDTADLAAHIIVREARPDLSLSIVLPIGQDRMAAEQQKIAAGDWLALVERVRSGPPVWNPARIPAVDDRTNFAEFVVHTEDVVRGDGAVGPRREVSERVTKAVWRNVSASARLFYRRSPVPVTLVAPGFGEVSAHDGAGDGVTLTGAPIELILTGFGRDRAAQTQWEGPPEAIAALRATHLGLV